MCNLFIQHKGGEKIRKQAITCRYLIPLLLISITLLFCASTAFATDEAIFVNGLSGNDANDGYTPDTAKLTIRNATGTVSSNGVITIADGVYTGTANTDIIIERNMTIQGQSQAGTIIYGTGTSRIFSIPNGINVTLSNLTIINGNSTNGGAIYNNGILTVTDTTFLCNQATGYGGAIYNHHKLTVTDCTFTSNNAGNGGAILNGGASTVTGCTFTSNIATQNDGGAITTDGTLNLIGSTFTSNIATRHGGAIFNYDTLNVTSSNFNSNTAADNGGAIFNQGRSTVTSSNFISNIAANNGGAIFNQGTSTVTDSAFTGNNALSFDGSGGAIYNDRNLIVNSGTFTSNSAGYEGGAIFNRDTATVTGSTFTNNSVTEGNGGAIYNSDSLTVGGSNFSNSTAINGGAIYNNNQLIANNNTFIKNTAHSGGAISSEGDITMHFNRIVENTAQYGSAIYNSKGDINATDNWWGSNNPDFGTLIDGDANYSPWLYLTFSADPNTTQGSTSTLTASFNQDTDGTTINQLDPANGHIPDGTPVTFTTTLGNVGSKSVVKYTVNGIATAILRADEAAGSALVGILADSQLLTSTVTINPASAATNTRVNAATSNTVGMQSTGAPIVPLALAVLSVLGGLTAARKKQ